MRKGKGSALYVCYAAVIAALYTLLTFLSSLFGLSSGIIQFRLSEALCILPVFTQTAIPGLAVGCLLANILTGAPVYDVVFGTLATLMGAYGTYLLRKRKVVASLAPVVTNTLTVPLVIRYAYGIEKGLLAISGGVFVGEFVCCTIVGLLLYSLLEPHKNKIFKKHYIHS